jgi:hypothetical protein
MIWEMFVPVGISHNIDINTPSQAGGNDGQLIFIPRVPYGFVRDL